MKCYAWLILRVSPYLHHKDFGSKSKNTYITTDFAENQIETITATHKSIKELYDFNNALYDIVASKLQPDEILWPLSMPCILDDNILESEFEDEKSYTLYRKYLTGKYGKGKQLISGIHFNFSFDEELLYKLYEHSKSDQSFKEFKNEVYLKTVNNYLYYRYLVTVFLSATPISHETYTAPDDIYAIRSSKYGYCNTCDLKINYDSIDSYVKSVENAVHNQKIIDEREIYDSIRIKNGDKFVTSSIENTGIRYIEIRNIDINPHHKGGISINDMKIHRTYFVILLIFTKC